MVLYGARDTPAIAGLAVAVAVAVAAAAAAAAAMPPHAALAQSGGPDTEMDVSEGDKYMVLAGFAAAVVAVFLFLARDIILGKKTSYDREAGLGSKRDKTFEKYHSDWGDDYEDLGRRRNAPKDRELREAAAAASAPDGSVHDYYEILGVPRDATQEMIKDRFRELAKRTHPDRTREDSEDEMAEINRAYEILSDRDSRERYDRYLGA